MSENDKRLHLSEADAEPAGKSKEIPDDNALNLSDSPQEDEPLASSSKGGNKVKQQQQQQQLTDRLRRKRRTKAEQQTYENNIKDFLDALLSCTSLLAISNIVKRKHSVLKTLWIIALTLCLILTIRQLYRLSNTYFSHPKSTKIELSYTPFNFPSVTVCNHNPLRRSQLPLYGQRSLNAFIEQLETGNYTKGTNETQQGDWLKFHKLISNHSIDDRRKMGYQITDFILHCSFAGEPCDSKMFSVSLSKTFGNCFTFNGWQSVGGQILAKNGREHGLIMTFYLQLDEYLKNFVPSSGVKVHIHEPGSMAFPQYSGFSVPPGFLSSVGVSLRKISRINRDNDRCDAGEDFSKNFQFKYTFRACTEMCMHSHIQHNCTCYDRTAKGFYHSPPAALQPCQSAQQLSCMMRVMSLADQGDLNCSSCSLPCVESHYEFKQSLSEWPSDSYEMRLFADLVDQRSRFVLLRNESKDLARRNLLKLLVYMDGLMAEHIIEENSYELDNYLSDIGGTLGLFLGFSVLTGFELLEAGALISAYLCGKIIYSSHDDDGAADCVAPRCRRQSTGHLMSLSGSTQSIHLHAQ